MINQIMNIRNIWTDYPKKRLPDVLSFIVDNRGKTVPTSAVGRKLIATNCIKNEYLYPSYEKIRYLTEETYLTWFRSHPIPGDIIFVCKGTPGRVCMVPTPVDFCIAQDMVALRANEKIIYNRYLLVVLRSQEIQKQIYNFSVGDVIPHFKKSFFEKLMIPIPPMDIQKTIGDLYFSFSLKIELNTQINQNLEQQAQAIFKSWFVDFEPFRDGKFVDSELGPIPEGWQVGMLSDIADITMGQSPNGDSYNEVGNGSVFYQGRGEFSDRFPMRRLYTTEPKRMAKAGDVLLSVRAPVGDINVANEDCCIGRGLAAIMAKKGYASFLLYTLKMSQAQFDQYNGAGTVFGCINKDALNGLKTLIPPENIIFSYENIVHPLDEQYLLKSKENKRLTTIRDTLLPKLMSGELGVPENIS